MTLVQGELRLVTDTPAEVSQVWVQASKERLHGTGMVTTGRASEQVTNGVVSFDALPGAAIMVLLVNGIPSTTVKLLIPDKANATLRECIEAVGLADAGELDALEELALEVSRIAAQIASADRLETWASETASAAAQAQTSKDEANDAANRAGVHESNARQAEAGARQHELNAKQAETNSKQSETNANAAAGRASSAANNVRGELQEFVDGASDSASSAADSASAAKTSEINAKSHEVDAASSAQRAEFAAEETIQQIEGDFATRNYVDEAKHFRGYATASHTLDTMPGGIYHVASGSVATSLGLPRVAQGWLEVNMPAGSGNSRRVTFKPVISGTRNTETWEIATSVRGGSLSSGKWERTEDNYSGALTTNDFYQNLPPGKYSAISGTVSVAAGVPTARGGYLKIETGLDTFRSVEFKSNNPGTGDKQYTLSTETTAGNAWHGNWFATNHHRMRSSPIVLTQPALSTMVSDKANYRQSQRIAFTCPTNVERVRIHVSARNYRTGVTWGGMTLRGIGIGEQTNGGQVKNLRTFESAKNAVIPTDGTDWVSEWETAFLSPGSTYLLSYGCDWTTAPGDMGLLSGTNWSNSRSEAWDEEGSSSGWVRLSLQPLDIWIECLAPADVPVYSYFGTSLTMGMDSGESVFSSYPQIHARMNGAFCAQTSAGGWAVVDASAQDPDIINRFGKAGESERVYALWGGSNDVNARGASVAEVADAIEEWSKHAKRYLKGSQYLQTTAGGLRYTGPDDPQWLNIEAMNEWLRTEAWLLPNISGVLDIHNLFTKPSEWWSQNSLFAYSETNGHFNVAGHKRYAMALDSGFAPKREIGEGALAAYNQGKGM